MSHANVRVLCLLLASFFYVWGVIHIYLIDWASLAQPCTIPSSMYLSFPSWNYQVHTRAYDSASSSKGLRWVIDKVEPLRMTQSLDLGVLSFAASLCGRGIGGVLVARIANGPNSRTLMALCQNIRIFKEYSYIRPCVIRWNKCISIGTCISNGKIDGKMPIGEIDS